MRHRPKCNGRSFCTRLDSRLNPEANHGKGLVELRVTSLSTGKSHRMGVVHKMSEKDRGLVLTVCPWCGVNLLELFRLSAGGENFPVVSEDTFP